MFSGKRLFCSLSPATSFKRDSNTGVFQWILQNFWEQLKKKICKRLPLIISLKTFVNLYWRIILPKFLSTPFALGWLSFLAPGFQLSYPALSSQPPAFSSHKSFSQLNLLLVKVQSRWLCATFNGLSVIKTRLAN